jgi:NAD(P)-dependent dehydrogenase (short-subunit alcohol dehydrogenase family)
MESKSILITGAASGIGLETARLFGNKGWHVGIFDINELGLKTLADELGPERCFSQIMDVTDPESVRRGIDGFADTTGGTLDILLNNAGIAKFGLYEHLDLKTQHDIVEVNLKGCLNCTHHALEYLKQTEGSRIINMSSASSIHGAPDLSVYSATKHALSALTEALNIEFEKHGIWVCDIKPPFVATPMTDVEEEIHSIEVLGIHMGPEKVAATVWKAAHREKVHWLIGASTGLALLCWSLPFARRFVVRKLTMPKDP